jgi:KaiC/GvpD/RAD55 family RecA-like ATPase
MNNISGIVSLQTLLKDPSKGWPTFEDLQKGRVFIENNLIKRIYDILRENNGCLIRGAEGRGKTVLARVVSYNMYENKKVQNIYFIDVRDIREEELHNVLKQAKRAAESKKTMLIIENAHYSLDKITSELVRLVEDYPETLFIFTSRDILPEGEQFPDPFKEWKEKGWYIDLTPGLEQACHIIETFVRAEKINYSLTDQDKDWIEKEFGQETINLRRLKWYLQTWRRTGLEKMAPLSSVKKEEVLKEVIEYYIGELRRGIKEGELMRYVELEDMLKKIAGIYQFEVNFYGKNFNKAALIELEEKGIITSIEGGYYRLQHPTDAVYIMEAFAYKEKKKSRRDHNRYFKRVSAK